MWIIPWVLMATSGSGAAKQSGETVDSGSFGMYVNGEGVAPEAIPVQQTLATAMLNGNFLVHRELLGWRANGHETRNQMRGNSGVSRARFRLLP
jgi:hypothetical protein